MQKVEGDKDENRIPGRKLSKHYIDKEGSGGRRNGSGRSGGRRSGRGRA